MVQKIDYLAPKMRKTNVNLQIHMSTVPDISVSGLVGVNHIYKVSVVVVQSLSLDLSELEEWTSRVKTSNSLNWLSGVVLDALSCDSSDLCSQTEAIIILQTESTLQGLAELT